MQYVAKKWSKNQPGKIQKFSKYIRGNTKKVQENNGQQNLHATSIGGWVN
jgi:hypothetical protein